MNYSWYIGQKVVCINPDGWAWLDYGHRSGPRVSGPAYGDVLTVRYTGSDHLETTLFFHEWPGPTDEFGASEFRPLDALTETMERIEKEGCPIEQQEPQLI